MNEMLIKAVNEILIKAAQSPGICSMDELVAALAFLESFEEKLQILKSAYLVPQYTNASVYNTIATIKWTIENFDNTH